MKRAITGLPAWVGIVREAPVPAGDMDTPESVHALLKDRAEREEVEVMWVILLNTRNKIMACQEIGRGTLNCAVADARTIFRCAIAFNASAVIVAHNHPSGDPSPSADDIALTKCIQKAGDILYIKLLDHVILGMGKYASFRQLGLL
jgi:DNA repair protein RadC